MAAGCLTGLFPNKYMITGLAAILIFIHVLSGIASDSDNQPNILWIVSEDNSPFLGCYGDSNAITPNLDKLAAEGTVYDNAFANAPVCAPMRNTIITGVYASRLGCQNMRSRYPIPDMFKFFPQYLRQAGYYCTNNAKEDYNTVKPENVWDESSHSAHYIHRNKGQPFFAVFNTNLSHEHKIHFTSLIEKNKLRHQPEDMKLAPYHPDLPEIRHCYATYYDYITKMDAKVGELLQELDNNGLAGETIVFYYSDHGGVLPRSKRFLFESGTKIPLIVKIPDKYKHLAPGKTGDRQERLISLVDLAPTVLSLANVEIPAYMTGHAFLGKQKSEKPAYVYFFRQRMDERYDMMRAVRDERYRYIRNYFPHRAYGQHLSYLWRSPATRIWQEAFVSGNCNEIQSRFWGTKTAEELYDVKADPHNVINLAENPAYREVLVRMRNALQRWMREERDAGFFPEGMMTDRAGRGTIYDLTKDADLPMDDIIETAELASLPGQNTLSQIISRLADDEPAVRFWAATACAINPSGYTRALPDLKNRLKDPVADVRIAAAEALCRMEDGSQALTLLVKEINNPNERVQLHALNVLEALGGRAEGAIKEILATVNDTKGRDEYFQRSAISLIKTLKPGWEDYIVW